MNFNELYPKKKEYYYLLMDIKTTAECNVSNCVIDKQKAKLLMRYLNKKEKEIKSLNNIINELEKESYLGMMENQNNNDYAKGLYTAYKYINDKLQELKGSNDNG